MFNNLPLAIIQYPTGRYGFAGSVPIDLAYVYHTGENLTDEMAAKIAKFGPGLYKKKVKSLSFDSESDAIFALTRIKGRGFKFQKANCEWSVT